MNSNKKMAILAVASICMAIASCKKDNAEDMYGNGGSGNCDTANVTYALTIKTIIDDKCATAGCHATVSPTGIDLSQHAGLANIAANGKLIASVTHSGAASAMPKNMPKLDDCSIAKIRKWVDDGAPNN